MLALVAFASMLVADEPPVATPGPPPASASARAGYEQVKAGAGRSAEAQVRLAYWCEANGLPAERLRHLSLAALADPTNAAARGLLGLVARDGRWARPDAVAAGLAADPARAALLAEYDRRRSATAYTADAQLALGAWADERGLKDQARAHYTAAARLDPGKDAAWRRLGYRRRDGRWRTDEQLAAERSDAEAQREADRRWEPLLARWRDLLARPARRGEAEAGLLSVTDPRAVPSIARVFGRSEADQARAVQLLGQVDSIASSRALATVVLYADSEDVRRVASEILRQRDPREFADVLISRIAKPIRYEVKPVDGPGKPGRLFVENKSYNVDRVYAPPAVSFAMQPGDRLIADANGLPVLEHFLLPYVDRTGRIVASNLPLPVRNADPNWDDKLASAVTGLARTSPDPAAQASAAALNDAITNNPRRVMAERLRQAVEDVARTENKDYSQFGFSLTEVISPVVRVGVGQMMLEAEKAAVLAQQQLAGDVAMLDEFNRRVRSVNDRAIPLLTSFTGRDLGQDPEPWKKWWVEQLGYRYAITSEGNKPTFVEDVPLAYQPAPAVSVTASVDLVGFRRMSCFGAGTLVRTIAGPRPIETLQVGDLVLTQSTSTGALGYQPVLVTHHNPPSTTFRIKLDGDEVVSSDFHRFWAAGRGWVMARNLKAGDRLRTLGGVAAVGSVEPGRVEPVFNLDVAGDADFFAGRAAALVHDNTLPDPRLAPFDAAAAATKEVAAR